MKRTVATDGRIVEYRAHLATGKFNFLAWAARVNGSRRQLGATDLMVLVQLVVRYDPMFPQFKISAEALANATNAGLSSVRRSLKNLERLGDIETVPRPGRSSAYRVKFDRAPPDWIKRKREKLAQRRATNAGEHPPIFEQPAKGAKKLAQGSAKKLAPTLPTTDQQPCQEVSTVYISSSKHSDSKLSSIQHGRPRPEVFKSDSGQVADEDVSGELADLLDDSPSNLPASGNWRRQEIDPAGKRSGGPRDFRKFIATWPREDANENVLRRTWAKHVVKGGADVDAVLAQARAWANYAARNPGAYVPYPGLWLAGTGWEFDRAPTGRPLGKR